MRNTLYYSFLLLCLVAALAGCEQFTGEKSDSPVIAEVAKESITQDDFIREVSRVPEWARAQFQGDEGKEKFLEELIKRELIYQQAQKMRLNKDKEYLDKVEEFKKMTLVSLILKKEVEEKAEMSDAEVKAFFDQNEDKFTVGTQLRASHILVETEDEANAIHDKIKNGADFAKLATSLSKDKGSAEKGGDLGYFGRGKMVPEFERAAASLKPGEVSSPVRTRFGFHIIKLRDIKKGDPANFDQSKESIKKQLLAEKKKQLFESYVKNLQSEAKIIKNTPALTAIPLPWEQTEEQPEPAPKPQE